MPMPLLTSFYRSSRRLAARGWAANRLICQLVIFGYGSATIIYLLARLTLGEQWHWIAFANNLLPWWALGGLIGSGAALFSRHRRVLITVQLPIMTVFLWVYGPLYWPAVHTSAQNHDGLEISAATYNIASFRSRPAATITVLQSLDAEIVGIQELWRGRAITLREELSDKYPYQVFYLAPQIQGVGLLSQYPVREQYVRRSRAGFVDYMRVVLDVKGTHVAVYVFHPHAPEHHNSPLTYDDSERAAAIDVLWLRLRLEDGPVLVLCDCNMTDQSDDYRKLNQRLDDAYREAGWGIGFTFPDRPGPYGLPFPLALRLDYVWHSPHFAAYDALVTSDSGTSDHRPVIARLILKAEEE
jgi:endonuclease/exonuclease/phosphatase (EEP) superfamily protein YafD